MTPTPPRNAAPGTTVVPAYACLALSMALVGVYVGLSPLLVAALPVVLLAWLRFGVAAVAMAGWLRPAPDDRPLRRREHGLLFLQSLLGNFLFTLCALYGTFLTGALSAGVVMAAIPAAVALLSRFFLGERLSARVWFAVGLSGVAVVMLAWVRAPQPVPAQEEPASWSVLVGHLLLLAAVCCEASYVVIGKRLSAHVRPARLTAIINLWGLLLSTPAGVIVAWSFDFSSVSAPVWFLFLFYALAASVLTVWLWMRGLQHVPAQQAGVFTVLLPLSSAGIGVYVLKEPWSAMHLLALAMAVAAVWLVTRTNPTAQA